MRSLTKVFISRFNTSRSNSLILCLYCHVQNLTNHSPKFQIKPEIAQT